jgi:hypothetical protein
MAIQQELSKRQKVIFKIAFADKKCIKDCKVNRFDSWQTSQGAITATHALSRGGAGDASSMQRRNVAGGHQLALKTSRCPYSVFGRQLSAHGIQ